MPGTLLLDDWRQAVEDQLSQHARQAFQIVGNPPSAPDPQQVLNELQSHAAQAVQQAQQGVVQFAQQRQQDAAAVGQQLQDYAQQASQGVNQFNQPPLAGASPQPPASTVVSGVTPFEQPPPQPAPIATPAATPHEPSPPIQTPGTQIANAPGSSGQVFPLAVKPDNAPNATYHSAGGSDLMAPRGTPVLNMQSGTVQEVFTDNGSHQVGGNAVLVHGDDGLDYYYAHFDQPSAVKVGQRVSTGEQIGAVGNSGNAFKGGEGATHLHIGIGHGISNGVGSEGGLGQNFNAQQLLTNLQSGIGQATGAARAAVESAGAAVQARVGQGQQDFVSSLQPLAQEVAARTGIDPNAMLAIAANETGWGRSPTAQQQNNLFSIQGDGQNGSRWATYSSPKDAFDAFVNLISSAPRYAQAWADRADPAKFVDDLRNAGYVADEPGFPAQGWVDQVKSIYGRLPAPDAAGPSPQRAAAVGSPVYDVGGTRPAPRAPIYAGVMQPAGDEASQPFQVIGDTAERAKQAVGGALGAAGEAIGGALGSAGQAIGGAISDVGSGAQQTATDLSSSRAADLALRQGRTQREAAELQLRMQEDRGVTDRSLLSALDEARSLILQSNKDTLPDALSRAGEILGMTDLGRAVAANQANPPLMGVREQIANAPVVGGALGMLRGPELLTDQEVLRSREADLARPMLERFRQAEEAKGQAAPPVSDDEVIRAARSLMTGQAIAMTGEGFGHPGRGAADAELQAARQAVDDLRSRFPQMSPGSLAASREGRALAEIEVARSRPSPAAEPASASLEQTLRRLDAYPEETARPVRDWATTTDATPSEVARTVDQWIAENPPSSLTPAEVSARPAPTDAGFRAPTMGERPVSTVGGTRPLTVSSGAQPLRINAPRGPLAGRPGGTSADRLDYLLDRGRYAPTPPTPETPIPRSPASALRPLATTVAGEAPLNVAGTPSSIDISPSGRRLTEPPSGTTADRLDQLLERGRYAPPGERPTPSALERANTVRLAGLLSSTTTHLVNATGNLVSGATAIPQQVIASGFDAARVGLGGGTRQRYLGEVLPMIKSWGPGVINSVPDALEILRTGVSPQNAGKLDHIGAGFRSDLLPVVGRMLGKKGGAVADSVIEMPLRMLQASDVLFRGGATNAFTNGLAVRKALQEGFKRGPELERRVATIMSNLDQHPELVKEANEQAARVVFQENREVPFVGRQVGRALEGSGALRFAESQVLPFTKTPYNITAQGAGLSPLGWASVAQAARSGNPGLALDRAARASIGTAAFGVAMWMGSHGLLTGAYPDDPQVRSTLPNGWREWSVRLPQSEGGAVYVPMQNFGAFGWPLAMASIATEAASQGKSTADPDQIAKAVTSMGRYVLDNTFLQGLSDATNALHDPERYGQKLLESEASSFAPYSAMGRELQRISGMVNRNPRDGMQGIIDAMAATNPLTAGSVPERTNALGDPVSPTVTGLAAGVLPLRAEVEQDDPTLKVLRDNGVGVSTIAKAINVPSGSVSLTEQEQEEFKKARGELIKRYVASEMRGADFAKGSLTARNKYLSDAVQRANRDARETMVTKWAADRGAWRARIEKKAVPEPYYLGGTEGG